MLELLPVSTEKMHSILKKAAAYCDIEGGKYVRLEDCQEMLAECEKWKEEAERWRKCADSEKNEIPWKEHYDSLKRQADAKITELEAGCTSRDTVIADKNHHIQDLEAECVRLNAALHNATAKATELEHWKNGAMLVDKETMTVDRYVRNHPEAIIGDSVWATVMRWLKERDRLSQEVSNWTETAAQHCCNEDYYRNLVIRIGNRFGVEAYTCDDGGLANDVLCDKVPELVIQRLNRLENLLTVPPDVGIPRSR